MFVTKKHLSRRTVLRGVGATVALPLLDAMIPARTALAQTAAAPTPKLGFIYFPHGAIMSKWTPAAEGKSFELAPLLEPLAPFKKSAHDRQRPREQARGRSHARDHAGHVAVGRERRASATIPYGGVTADQIAAQHIGQDTPLPSLEVATEEARRRRRLRPQLRLQLRRDDLVPHAVDAAADGVQPAQAVPAAVRPGRHAGGARGARGAVREHSRRRRRQGRGAAEASSGRSDRAMLDDYLESVREIERRVQKMEANDLSHIDAARCAGRHPEQASTSR